MRIPECGEGQTRIGVAIPVPDPFAAELQQARDSFGDPLAFLIEPHITLLGPTVVDLDRMEQACAHLTRVAGLATPFRVQLRGSASFRPVSPVVFVQVVRGIAECERLEQAVRSGLFKQDLRFNYHPHVTVAHDVPERNLDAAFDAMADYDAQFDVTHLDLYEHGDDGTWRTREEFPLGR